MNAYADAEEYFAAGTTRDDPEQTRGLIMMEDHLRTENETLLNRIIELRGESERFDADIAFVNDYMSSCEEEFNRITRNINELESKKNVLIELINSVQFRMKTINSDELSSVSMKKLLDEELVDLISERDMILGKLDGLKNGIKTIELNKQNIVPFGKRQDDMLKQARILLKEAQNRMELSILLKK